MSALRSLKRNQENRKSAYRVALSPGRSTERRKVSSAFGSGLGAQHDLQSGAS
jgi:hypothetical protein